MRKGKPHTPCFVCFFKPTLVLGSIVVAPLTCNCPHSSNPSRGVEYRVSQSLRFLAALLCCSVILTLYVNVQEFLSNELSIVEKYLMVNDILLCVVATLLFVIASIQVSAKLVELQCIAEVIEDAEKRGIIFLDSNFVKKNMTMFYGGVGFIATLETIVTIRFLMKGDFDLSSVRFYISDSIFFIQGFLAIHYHNVQIVYPCCFKRVFKQVKFALKQRLDVSEEIVDDLEGLTTAEETECLVYSSKRTFEEQLKDLRRMYSSIVFCYKESENFMNPSHIIFMIGAFASFTIKQVVLIKCIEYQLEFDLQDILSLIRPYVFLSTTAIWTFLVEMTTNVVSHSLLLVQE